jgi:diguanylate cyclase (GGDEF)-like protein
MSMALLGWLVVSVSVLALLGCSMSSARRAAHASERERCESERLRRLLQSAQQLVAASRHSSTRVLAELGGALREAGPQLDSILIFVPSGSEFVCAYSSGARIAHYAGLRLRRDGNSLPAVAAERGCRAVALHDEDRLVPTDRAALAMPLLDQGGLRAVAYVSTTQSVLGNDQAIVQIIEHAALPYALALEREADRTDAMQDGLTGLMAPRAFRRLLHEELVRADCSNGRVLALLFIDTDRFKRVNDELGHQAGDAVLISMAGLLRSHLVAGVDIGARNGGDEFCALLREVTKSQAIERAHVLCEAVRRHDFGIEIPVTASIGVATFPYDASTSSELLESADAAMYHSKRSGRDRVAFASVPGAYATV